MCGSIFVKKTTMKKFFFITLLAALTSCGVKVPYTNEVRDQFGLDDPKQARKVQFYTSATIILQKSKSAGGQGTNDSGVLVSSSSNEENRIIIPVNTKCVFEGFGENGEIIIRFETGPGKTLTFAARPGQQTSKYYLVADWSGGKGGALKYGADSYTTASASGNTYLMVVMKKLQRTKRKDRIVKGMKV
jgi:hypothetical protein